MWSHAEAKAESVGVKLCRLAPALGLSFKTIVRVVSTYCPFWASMYRRMVSCETFPDVAAK